MDWQLILTLGSILTAIGVIIGFASKWGRAIAKQIVMIGFLQMTGEDLAKNPSMQAGHNARQEIISRLDKIQEVLQDDMRTTLKLELKSLYKDYPERVDVIESTYKKYHDIGGNSYITGLHEAWRDKYEKKTINNALGKGDK